jgi:hypothetical protein
VSRAGWAKWIAALERMVAAIDAAPDAHPCRELRETFAGWLITDRALLERYAA